MPGVIVPIYSVGTQEVEAGGLPLVPGQDELQNEHKEGRREGKIKMEGRREKERERVRTSLKIAETGLTN